MSNKVPQIRFNGYSDAWEERKLGELSNIVGGGTPSTSNPEYWDGDIDWYAPAEIGEQSYVSKSKKTITELGLKKSSARILPVGTVLFTSRAGIGNTAILAKEATTNQGFQSIVPVQNKLDSYFIFSRTNELKRYGKVTGAGSTFVEVSGKQMSKMSIMVPQLSEQQKIGSFFKQLDDTIALHQRKLDLLKEQKKGYLQKMFSKNGAKVPELRFAGFADDWEERKLGDITTLITKGTTPKDKSWTGTVNYVKTESIDKESGDINTTTFTSLDEHEGYLKRSQLKDNDILFSIVGTLGRVGIIKKDNLPANTNQQISIIRVKKDNPQYILYALKTYKVKQFIESDSTIGAQPALSLWQIEALEIPLPSLEEQEKIGSFFKQLDDTIALHQRKLDLLKEQKKGFLQKMFV